MKLNLEYIRNNIEIQIILVTYNPNYFFLENSLKNLLSDSNIKKIIIIDNGSDNLEFFKKDLFISEKIIIKILDNNIGLTKAQLIAINISQINSNTFLFFLDQDSFLPRGFTENCKISLEKILKKQNSYNFALCSEYQNNFNFINSVSIPKNTEPVLILKDLFMSSGLLISANYLKNIGSIDSNIHTDYLDTELSLRIRKKFNNKIYQMKGNYIFHKLGDESLKFIHKNAVIHLSGQRLFNRGKTLNYLFFNCRYFDNKLIFKEILKVTFMYCIYGFKNLSLKGFKNIIIFYTGIIIGI